MYSTNPGATAARLAELESYFSREVLSDGKVVCTSIDGCRRSALLDGAGRRRPDVAFSAGQLPHLGRHYDLAEDGRPVRIMLVGMETGRPEAGVDLDRRREQLAASVATAMTGRNPHMQGVTHALRLLHGRPVGTDRAGELIDLGATAAHLFDTMALTNVRLCSAYRSGTTESRATSEMTRNCLRHLAATVSILEPTVCVLQGAPLVAALAPLVTPLVTVGPQVRRVRLAGIETFLVAFSHPTARGAQRWGGMSGVPYLASTVEPALRSVRRQLVGSSTRRAAAIIGAEATGDNLPERRPTSSRPARTMSSTAQVAEHARRVVAAEVEVRGGVAREVAVGRRRELLATPVSGPPARLRVVSRRTGDWQVSIREGDSAGSTGRFWVFVDLGSPSPRFFVVPDTDAVLGIRRRHAEYLARNGGRRVRNDDSLHQAIRTRDVQEWVERWDLLRL